jgi:lactoylglutathione lyase
MTQMKLNHLNLTVTEVAETRKLFETYFGFTGLKELGNDKFIVLFGEDGFVLTLMRGAQVRYPETFHIGFIQESEERVNEINRHLKEDGFDVNPPGKSHGAWTFYFRAPGGITIEVMHQPEVSTWRSLLSPRSARTKKQSCQEVSRAPLRATRLFSFS